MFILKIIIFGESHRTIGIGNKINLNETYNICTTPPLPPNFTYDVHSASLGHVLHVFL